jgi:hypothetical protein
MAPVPHVADRRVDSLKAVALTQSGRFAGPESLQIWSSEHIDDLLVRKAMQPLTGATPETRGLGWSQNDAEDLRYEFLYDLIFDKTGGARVELDGVHGHPPLDHEDACVFTTALQAALDITPPSIKYCITRDRAFRQATTLSSNVWILYPYEFVRLVQRSRQALAVKKILPAG